MSHARPHVHRPMTSNFWTLTSHSGHEFPFSIKMSHIRDGGSSAGGLGGGAFRDPTSPTDCPGVLLLDQCLPPDTQCQFILKPSKVSPGQAPLIGKTAAQNLPILGLQTLFIRSHDDILGVGRHFFCIYSVYFRIKGNLVCG